MHTITHNDIQAAGIDANRVSQMNDDPFCQKWFIISSDGLELLQFGWHVSEWETISYRKIVSKGWVRHAKQPRLWSNHTVMLAYVAEWMDA